MGTSTCEHGYEHVAAKSDCPRCADRPESARPLDPPRFPQTRWHKTATTLGPALKVAITVALVLPLLVMLYALRFAHENLANAFLVVPAAALLIIDVQLLPELWAKGRQERALSGQATSTTGDTNCEL